MASVNEPPEDVLIDILSRLPARSILRFKSVSKRWYSLVQNPIFISLHRTRARLFYCVSQERTVDHNPWSMHLLPDQTSIHDLDLSFTRPHLGKDFSHQGSCNGLMCLSLNSNIVICNPATREYRLLPQPPCHRWHTNYLGFAFDSKTNDYKVVRVATLHDTMRIVDYRIHIYCMSADSWEELFLMALSHNFNGYHHHPCTSKDGVFYWLTSYGDPPERIDALNTVEGSFKRRFLPVSLGIDSDSRINLCLLNDSLALVVSLYDNWLRETQFDVWLMDEYRIQECWTKKCSIGPILGSQRPFGFQPNNEVLMTGCDNGLIVSYNHSTGETKEYKQLCNLPELLCLRQVFQYAESLVSVKRRLDWV